LRQGFGCGLVGHRDRDCPTVVVDHEDNRQLPDTGGIERLGDIALRGRAVAEQAHRHPLLAPQLERKRDPDGVGRVGPDRNADREILARLGEIAAPLVAAPEQQQLDRADPAPQLSAVLAKARQQHILGLHRARDPDGDCFLAQCRSKGAETSGALQRHRLGIEAPRQHHRPVERNQLGPIAGKIGQWAHRIPFGVEKAAIADFEPSYRGRQRRPSRLGNCG
jgi:hypothetical protein